MHSGWYGHRLKFLHFNRNSRGNRFGKGKNTYLWDLSHELEMKVLTLEVKKVEFL